MAPNENHANPSPALWWLLLFATATSIFAASKPDLPPDREGPLAQYQVDVWTTEHGLPQNSITTIAQTTDSYLWLGTFNGLSRFDGARFVNFDAGNTPALKNSRIIYLSAAPDGSLWIVTETRAVLRYKDGLFTPFGKEEGVPNEGFVSVRTDRSGRLWFNSLPRGNVFNFTDGRFKQVSGPFDLIKTMAGISANSSNVWFGAESNVIRIDPPDLKTISPPSPIAGLGADSRGRLIAACFQGIHRLDGDAWTQISSYSQGSSSPVSMLADRRGSLWGVNWLGTVWIIETNKTTTFKFSRHERPEQLRCIFEDPEGNIWIGSNGAGLYRLKPRLIRSLGPDEGLSGNVVKSVTQDTSGKIWAISASMLNEISSDPLRVLNVKPITNNWVLQSDRKGALWLGGFGTGLAHIQNGLHARLTNSEGKIDDHQTAALYLDAQNVMWAGGGFGFVRLHPRHIEDIPIPTEKFRENPIRAITQDSKGQFYLAPTGYGLWIGRDSTWRRFTRADGLPDDNIWALFTDSEDSIWIGFPSHGLARFKNGKLFHFTETNQWPVRSIYAIIEDDQQYLWISSNQGLYRVPRHELNQFADGESKFLNLQHFTAGDGLPTTEFANGQQPTVCKAADGKLWFATVRGLAIVDPNAIGLNSRPPPTIIEQLNADDRPIQITNAVAILPPGRRRLEFHFTALSFTAPEKVHFRVKLEGLDDEWVDTGPRRFAHYSRVPPGEYKFRVRACNNDGIWNESGATLALKVQPHYWETTSFTVLMALAALAVIFAFYQNRVREFRRQQALQHEFSRQLIEVQETERKRLASELHDSLGQNILLLKTRASLGASRLGKTDPAANDFNDIASHATNALNDVRSIAYSLRPVELDCLGLTKSIAHMVERSAASSNIQFQSDLDDISGRLPPELQIHLYRIIQETINNIIKHSGATVVQIEIKTHPDYIHIEIYDNGQGFDQTTTRRGLGLSGISERVRLLNGTLEFLSAPGKGARLSLTIPTKT